MPMSLSRFAIPVLILCLLPACSKKNSHYSEEKRQEISAASEIVLKAIYKKMADIKGGAKIDIIDARGGEVIRRVEHGVVFKVKSAVKGLATKEELTFGVANANIALGITPGEEPGRKIYTLYLDSDPRYDSAVLIGAEWEQLY